MIKHLALKYLGYKEENVSMLETMDAYLEELERYCHFKAFHTTFNYQNHKITELDLSLNSQDAEVYFKGCTQIMMVCATLGIETERYLKRLEKTDMRKAVIMDALASSYLEVRCDEYESFIQQERTYRFAPGYGDLPLSLNRVFYESCHLHKYLGVSLTETNLFIPQKTMLGLIGLGNTNLTKSCHHCILYDQCSLRKEGNQCYRKN